MNCGRPEDFRTCCRLCLSRQPVQVDCLEVAELCAAVVEVFGFEILKEDKCTTRVCRECVTKVTGISMYRSLVIYNQKCIKQYSALQSKILSIPTVIKLEDDDDDDEDVVFIPATPQSSTNSTATSCQKSNHLPAVSSTSSIPVQQPKRVRATARKSTTKLPFNVQLEKRKFCTKRLKVVCSEIRENDVEKVFLNSFDKKLLNLNGKIKISDKIQKKVTKPKTVPPIRLKLAKISVNEASSAKPHADGESSRNPQGDANPQSSQLSTRSEDDRSLIEIRNEILMKPPQSASWKKVMPKIVFTMPSSPKRPFFNSTINGNDETTKNSNQILSLQRNSPQQNAVQPATSYMQSNTSNTSAIPITHSSNNISTATITVNTPYQRKPLISPQYLNAGSFVSIPITATLFSSKNNNLISTTCTETSTTATPVVVFSSPRITLASTRAATAPTTTPHSNLIITDPRTISYSPEVGISSIPNEDNTREAVASTSSACLIGLNNHKVKVLSVNELNNRATNTNNQDSSNAANATATNGGVLKLPIKITMVRIRDEMQIKLANWNNDEINVSHLSESEKNAVRSSLMAEESRKQFILASKMCKPDNVTIELLRTLNLTDVFLKD